MKTRTVTVEVKAKDIRLGKPLSELSCPISLALDRAEIEHYGVWASFVELPHGRTADLPASAVKSIDRFDSAKPVRPFAFRLKIPTGE